MKSYVRNTINLSCANILLTSVINALTGAVKDYEMQNMLNNEQQWKDVLQFGVNSGPKHVLL